MGKNIKMLCFICIYDGYRHIVVVEQGEKGEEGKIYMYVITGIEKGGDRWGQGRACYAYGIYI